ncbi:MAG: GNAT family N-acetyltransferase, partial [Acidobacteriota bacterium]|nr:GNAT family N-acetyltransferase [Acidobacteriota bacterium]
LTLRHRATLVYKYGCSDRKFSNLGGMQLAFWNAIQRAKELGLEELDMGRSDWDDSGLIAFKDRWGAASTSLTYWRHGSVAAGFPQVRSSGRFAKPLFDRVPSEILATIGGLLYRHAG